MAGHRVVGLLLALALGALPAFGAEVPRLLADVNPAAGAFDASGGPQPEAFATLGDKVLFVTDDGPFGDGAILWRTDGTAAGTVAVTRSLCQTPCSNLFFLGTWNGLAFYGSDSESPPATGMHLWRSDGTAAGTFPISKELNPAGFSLVQSFFAGDRAYFVGCRALDGCEPWTSDGTAAGTRLLKDTWPGYDGFGTRFLNRWRGRTYFLAFDGDRSQLWQSDGTPEGTLPLHAVGGDDPGSRAQATGSRFFFTAYYGREIWASDGTAEGTLRLHREPSNCDSDELSWCPENGAFTVAGDGILYASYPEGGGSEIWSSDGTAAGTRRRLTFDGLVTGRLAHVGGRWLIPVSTPDQAPRLWTADEALTHAEPLQGCDGGCPDLGRLSAGRLFAGTDAAHGTELWATDGTAAGTRRLSDACPGPCSGVGNFGDAPMVFAEAGSRSLFLADPSGVLAGYSNTLWTTDGTQAGTRQLADSISSNFGRIGNRILFGSVGVADLHSQVMATDGTPQGTGRVAVLKRVGGRSWPQFLVHGDTVLVSAEADGVTDDLYRTGGTPERLSPFFDLGHRRQIFVSFDTPRGRFFTVYPVNESQSDLWVTDGTVAGTRVVASFPPEETTDEFQFTLWKGGLLFPVFPLSTDNSPAPCAFWTSDGTAKGTREILPPVAGRRCPAGIVAAGDRFLFVSRVEAPQGPVPQIFVSDGTPAGTRQLTRIEGTREVVDDGSSVRVGGIGYFRIGGVPSGTELWRSDGTPEGTYWIAADFAAPANLFGSGGSLYFTAGPAGGPRGVYRLSGPAGSPVLLAPVAPLPESDTGDGSAYFTATSSGQIFFAAWDPQHGVELWSTDGTAAGTRRVSDVRPGPASSRPEELTAAGDRLFFTAEDDIHGRELWESDGTAAGTRLVADILPGGFSSFPSTLTVANGRLYFAADDGKHGIEPWALRLSQE